jgi:phosphoglycolate phosphatase
MGYDLAIFDFDGTLADSAEWFFGSLNEVADRFGFLRTTDEERVALRQLGNREMLARLQVPMWKLPAIARHMRQRALRDIASIRLFDGIPEALADLHARGTALAVVSSNAEQNVRLVLGDRLAGNVGFFGCGSSLFGKPAKLRQAMKRLGVSPARTICVGDEVRDIEAARAAAAASAAVTWGYAAPDALISARPAHVLRSVADIATL